MDLNNLQPISGRHSIQMAVFMAQWEKPLKDTDLQAFRHVFEKVKEELPAYEEERGTAVSMGPTGVRAIQEGLVGVSFRKAGDSLGDPPAVHLQVTLERCQITFRQYDRWGPTWKHVQQWIELVLQKALHDRQLAQCGLQYVDVYKWRDAVDTLPVSQIFRPDSLYLPKNVFHVKNLWHAHHGFYEHFTSPVKYRLLENVNVSYQLEKRSPINLEPREQSHRDLLSSGANFS
jgi:uncharacterized protein (TIGR04255 family)